jgi:NAD(P)-dependent dehydrogenase (short-subunit alcohol dehydrogenase family)
MRLSGKVALVTGAAQGIGLACAQAFAREGAKVLLTDLKEDIGRREVLKLRAENLTASFVACDVSRKDQVESAIRSAVSEFGKLDILVANAGIVHAAEFLDLEEKDFDRVLSVNLKGVFLAGQAAARQMVKQGKGGSIIKMSSVNAVLAIPNQVPYVVSKGAINQLTKVMSVALAPKGIRVNGIGPEPFLRISPDGGAGQQGRRSARSRHARPGPHGRASGSPQVAVFLASDESSHHRADHLSGRRAPRAQLHRCRPD